jgi:hypothetical protein
MGAAMSAPPVLEDTGTPAVRYSCGSYGVVLMRADGKQVHRLIIHCTACDAYNSTDDWSLVTSLFFPRCLNLTGGRHIQSNRYFGVGVGAAGGLAMGEFVFKVNMVAEVRVRAADESVARKVVPGVLGAPGAAEIALANENQAALGRNATISDVDFDVGSIKLANRRVDPAARVRRK